MANLHLIVLASVACAICAVQAERLVRVIEGTPTEIEKAPWLVQVVYAGAVGISKVNSCAGSILNKRQVLTSAHCFPPGTLYDEQPDEYMGVLVGATEKVEGGKLYHINSVAKHPKFMDGDKMNQMYDLAIITLDDSIKFSDEVQPIELATKKVTPNKTKVVGGGWGVRKDNAPTAPESFAPTLITAEMVVLPEAWCQKYFANTDLHEESKLGLMCTKPITGMPCNGDSGGGLWVPATRKRKAQLFGVLQGGVVCDVMVGIPFYIDLLQKDIREFLRKKVIAKF